MRTHLQRGNNPITLHSATDGDLRVTRRPNFGKPRGFWYEVDGDWRRWLEGEGYDPELSFTRREVNWRDVAKSYDGVEIAPYIWERRLDGEAHNWYYGWDCASGCIWNPKLTVVTHIGRLPKKKAEALR